MAMRISGLMSGMDTETIISQLVEAKRVKVNKAVKAQKSLKYKQDAWKTLNTQINKLHRSALSNMRFESAFIKKTTKVLNSNKVSVITGDGAMNGVHSLQVNNLAQSGNLTGGKLGKYDQKINGDTKLSELGYDVSGKGTIVVENGTGENSRTPIVIDESTTVNDFIGALRSTGLNANFDEANRRIFVASKAAGTENDFKIRTYAAGEAMYDSTEAANGAKALQALGLDYSEGYKNELKSDIGSFIQNANASMAANSAVSGDDAYIFNAAKAAGLVQTVDVGGGVMKEQIRTNLSDEDYDKLAKEMYKQTGLTNQAIWDWTDGWSERGRKMDATDAVITLDGVEYTSSRNTFEINGLTINVNAKTDPGESITITTEDDTNGIYDMIKDFFKEYNALINQMDKLYYADSAKGFEPLLDEEKDAMSDSEIEEWEEKIKDSILRKDTSLNTIASEMKRIMMEGVNMAEDGEPEKKMYLSQFGINTLGYFIAPENEKNAYHIDGDSDDENTSGNADKLKSMIANDPDTVVKFFTRLSKNLYEEMTDIMKHTDYSSAYTAYDDIKMKKEYDDYTVKIKELEDKLADYEDKWYAKFAAMETAMAKMQQNASAVTSLLGGGM